MTHPFTPSPAMVQLVAGSFTLSTCDTPFRSASPATQRIALALARGFFRSHRSFRAVLRACAALEHESGHWLSQTRWSETARRLSLLRAAERSTA